MNSSSLFFIMKLFHLIPDTSGFGVKRFLLKLAGVKVGENVRCCSSIKIVGDNNLSVGKNTWIGHEVFISASESITIGADVNIAPRVYVGTGTHEIDYSGSAIAGKGVSKPITICDGVWLCANSIILPGVTIGKKAIVAAGSVVTKDVPEGELWGGVPANFIKNISI